MADMTSPEIDDLTETFPPENGQRGSSVTPQRQQERATSINRTSFLTPPTRPPLPHPQSAPQPSIPGLVTYPDISAFSNPDHGRLRHPAYDSDQLSTTRSNMNLPSNSGYARAILDSYASKPTASDVEDNHSDESYYLPEQAQTGRPIVRNDPFRDVSQPEPKYTLLRPESVMTKSVVKNVGNEASSSFQLFLQGCGNSPPESPLKLSQQIRKTRSQTRKEALSTRAKAVTGLLRSTSMPERRLESCQHNAGGDDTETAGRRAYHEDNGYLGNRENSSSLQVADTPQDPHHEASELSLTRATSLITRSGLVNANEDESHDTPNLEHHGSTSMVTESRKKTKKPPIFTKSHGNNISRRETSDELFACMKRDAIWSNKAMEDGCIYVLRILGEPDYVKIGRTARTVAKRRSEHLQCGYDLEVVDDSCYTRVPCHQRLEALIHLEMRNVRHHFKCSCKPQKKKDLDTHVNDKLTTHGEWFKIDIKEALKVVAKWRDWMSQKPYWKNVLLKPEWTERIETLEFNKEYSQILETEYKEGELFKSLLHTPSTGLAWIDRGLLATRYDAKGRLLSNRWGNIKSYWKELLIFCIFQYMTTLGFGEWMTTNLPGLHWYVHGLLSLMNFYWL